MCHPPTPQVTWTGASTGTSGTGAGAKTLYKAATVGPFSVELGAAVVLPQLEEDEEEEEDVEEEQTAAGSGLTHPRMGVVQCLWQDAKGEKWVQVGGWMGHTGGGATLVGPVCLAGLSFGNIRRDKLLVMVSPPDLHAMLQLCVILPSAPSPRAPIKFACEVLTSNPILSLLHAPPSYSFAWTHLIAPPPTLPSSQTPSLPGPRCAACCTAARPCWAMPQPTTSCL